MRLFRSIADFILPRYCKVCGRRLTTGEEHLCLSCYASMPFLEWEGGSQFSPAEKILLTEKQVARAASVMQYDKDSDYRKILYHLKYYGHPDVGAWLARIGAQKLDEKGFFDGIDLIVPIPLTKRKKRKRGYNQCSYISYGLRMVCGLPVYEDVLVREKKGRKQAGLGRFQRWGNASGLFTVMRPDCLKGKHVLLVDDVMTTGATLCAAIQTIHETVPDAMISVFTLAVVEQ